MSKEKILDTEEESARRAARLRSTAMAVVLELRAFMSLNPDVSEQLEVFKVVLIQFKVSSAWVKRSCDLFPKLILPEGGDLSL
jgi:hypothetical protein